MRTKYHVLAGGLALWIVGLLSGAAWATDYTWDGTGGANNGGNWSTANNWNLDSSYPQTGGDNATLPAATAGSRSITVDVAVAVNNLTWPASSAGNTLLLNADLTVTGLFAVSSSLNTLNVNGRTLTLAGNNNTPSDTPTLSGAGRIVKVGTNTFNLGYNYGTHPFSGELIISNGVVYQVDGGGFLSNCTNVMVCGNGDTNGTYWFQKTQLWPSEASQHYTISGPGYNNQGALHWAKDFIASYPFVKPITVQSDATCYIGSGITVEYTGTLGGGGALTLIGGGHFKIMNGAATHTGMIIVSNGTLSVPGSLPGVTNITILAGSTLNGAQAHFPLATVINNGTWNSTDTASTWSGLGDNQTWSQGSNWYGAVPTNIEAIIPATASARNIRIDIPAHVSKLTWKGGGGGADTITLDADPAVDSMNAAIGVTLNVNGRTLTMNGNNNTQGNTPRFSGSGYIVKLGTDTFNLGDGWADHPFSGELIISNGVFFQTGNCGFLKSCADVRVCGNGQTNGTYWFDKGSMSSGEQSLHYTIFGPGYNNQGALHWSTDFIAGTAFAKPIAVQSDATCYIGAGLTVEYTGTLGGSGTLTLIGGGHFKIMNGAATHNGSIIVSNGTLSVAGSLPQVTNITIKAGGTLNGSSARFPSATVVNNGGTWNDVDTSSTWSGLGDNATWSQSTNWYGAVPTNIEAIIPATASTRNIRIDIPAHVSKLTWKGGGGGADTITLDADLAADVMNAAIGVTLNVNGRTLTMNGNNNTQSYTPRFSGSGRIVKLGTDTFNLGDGWADHPFSGELIISNGVFFQTGNCGFLKSCTNVTACGNGETNGTYWFDKGSMPSAEQSLHYTISGPGYNNQGALHWTVGFTAGNAFAKPITVQSDATCYIGSGLTVEHTGALDGNGVMTVRGGGTYDMNNTWTFSVNGATANGIIASNSIVDISGCTLSITNLGETAQQYVIVDYSSSGASLVGSFAATNGIPSGWVVLNNTPKFPKILYLQRSGFGTVIMVR